MNEPTSKPFCGYGDCAWCYHPDVELPQGCVGYLKEGCPLKEEKHEQD